MDVFCDRLYPYLIYNTTACALSTTFSFCILWRKWGFQ